MRKFLPWIGRSDVFSVRYEALAGPERYQTVHEIVDFFGSKADREFDRENVILSALTSLDPSRSHTFRAGRAGGWRSVFTQDHERAFADVAGDLNRTLG
jgi:hypothetical protein